MTLSTGEYLIRLLEAYDVDTIFGIPGVHTVEFYRGLANSDIRHVTPRHEQAAGYMADGYARTSKKPGVCFIISGPGMTNILAAMGQAYGDSIPMLVVSTVNAHGKMGSCEFGSSLYNISKASSRTFSQCKSAIDFSRRWSG